MDILGLTLLQLKSLIGQKKITGSEINDFYFKRISKYDHELCSYITPIKVDEKISKRKKQDYLPIAVKDNFCTKGIRTTAASKVLDNFIPPYESTVTKRLLDANFSFLGKTNMDAWGHGASTETSDYKITKNPYDLSRVAGGSSGGSAAAVAAGLAPAAIGSDTGGSIRGPASWCGIVGLKPTYGRVSRYGLIAMGSSWDCPGPMAQTVEDCAYLLQIIAGRDDYDANCTNDSKDQYLPGPDKKKTYTIGIPEQYLKISDKEVAEKNEEVFKTLQKKGYRLKKVKLIHPKYAISVYTILQRSEVSSNLARFDGIRYGNQRNYFAEEARRRIMLGAYTLSHGYYEKYYRKAEKVRQTIRKNFDDIFKEVDFIACPAMPSGALKLGDFRKYPFFGELIDQLSEPGSAAGIPVIAIPIGLSKDHLPVGMQIMGRHFDEKRLLNFAYQVEKIVNFDRLKIIKDKWTA